ncbi:hypothetical protein D3C86_2152400 [compost metagenome]
MLAGDARAVVANLDHQQVAVAAGADFQRLPGRVEAQGVAQQVVQRALEQVRPALQLQVGGHLDAQFLLRRQQPRIFAQLFQ